MRPRGDVRPARHITRAACVAVAAATLVTILGTPAHAHTRTAETTNVVSRITLDPTPPGIEVTVHTGGLLVEVVNRTDEVLHVHGYDGEPYLRIGPDGVEENAASPAAWLNQARFGDVAVPPHVDAAAAPDWRRVSGRPRWVWHDHRTHWMAPSAPSFVDASPLAHAMMRTELVGPIGRAGDAAGEFSTWSIPITLDGRSTHMTGVLEWVDPPPSGPWLAIAALLVGLALVGCRGERAVPRAAIVVGTVAAVNVIHLVDDLVAFPADPLDELFGVLHTTLFLVVGLGGAAWARWASSGRVLALGVASGGIAYHQGLVHLPMLFASQFPTVWPDGLVRMTIALGLAQSALVAWVVVNSMRRAQADMRAHAG